MSFLQEVNRRSGEQVQLCFQCFKCSLGCPVAFAMDYLPHQLMRLIQLEKKEEALNSHTIWLCAACETCTMRCPNGIDIAKVIDTLRQMAIEENKIAEKEIVAFHRSFLETVYYLGRAYELGLMAMYKLRTKRFFDDLWLVPELLKRQKLSLKASKVENLGKIKEIFKKAALWQR